MGFVPICFCFDEDCTLTLNPCVPEDVHVFGHTHYGWCSYHDGTRFVQACFWAKNLVIDVGDSKHDMINPPKLRPDLLSHQQSAPKVAMILRHLQSGMRNAINQAKYTTDLLNF